MKRGVAVDRPENVQFLEACPAVTSFRVEGDALVFVFDPDQQPAPETVPEGVYFDPAAAPF